MEVCTFNSSLVSIHYCSQKFPTCRLQHIANKKSCLMIAIDAMATRIVFPRTIVILNRRVNAFTTIGHSTAAGKYWQLEWKVCLCGNDHPGYNISLYFNQSTHTWLKVVNAEPFRVWYDLMNRSLLRRTCSLNNRQYLKLPWFRRRILFCWVAN
ncbi:hypothetical protein AB1N83_011353 [Pleurotus pulmonarius]